MRFVYEGFRLCEWNNGRRRDGDKSRAIRLVLTFDGRDIPALTMSLVVRVLTVKPQAPMVTVL